MLIDDVQQAKSTVLVVEDDEDMRRVYSAGLGHVGYRVITAATGTDGLRAARDEHPDVIVLDLSIAGADGWEVVRCLKASQKTGDIPVLLRDRLLEPRQSRASRGLRRVPDEADSPRHASYGRCVGAHTGVVSGRRAPRCWPRVAPGCTDGLDSGWCPTEPSPRG